MILSLTIKPNLKTLTDSLIKKIYFTLLQYYKASLIFESALVFPVQLP